MASLMIYLALTACATTAVGAYAGPEMVAWAEDEWWHDDECERTSAAGVAVAGGVHVGASSRSSCDRDGERKSERDECRRCDG